jgi:ACS family D-galactonate transporter-like MFS transporter
VTASPRIGLGSIAAAPIATGMIVGATGSFGNAFLLAGVILLIGIVAFVFLMGRIEPIPDPH